MAQQGIQMDQEKLCCSICLDLLKDPVTIPCGHNYCMNCIRRHWDGEDQKRIYSCPQCREIFTPRPDLKKNTMMADLVEEVKKTRLQPSPDDLCYAGPGDVSCDFCTKRKLKAVKSCLQCLVSYCQQHLQPHYQSPAFENHKLVDPSKKLQENICSLHNEVMKIFCRSDQQCICFLCSLDEHKGHDTVSAAAERNDKQRFVGLKNKKLYQRIQNTEKDVRMLQQDVEAINQSADKAVTNSEKTFKDLISLIEKRNTDVKQQIRSKQTDEVRKATELQETLNQELVELRRRSSELEQLSQTEDHIQFLHNYALLSDLSESTNPPNISSVHRLQCFDDVTAAVSKIRDEIQEVLKEDWTRTSPRPRLKTPLKEVLKEDWTRTLPRPEEVSGLKTPLKEVLKEDWTRTSPRPGLKTPLKEVLKEDWTRTLPRPEEVSGLKTPLKEVLKEDWTKTVPRPGFRTLSAAEPKTRAEFLQYSRRLTLDPNTAHRQLIMSEGNKKVTVKREIQSYPSSLHHPDRFIEHQQVLSRESLTGRCYWEVELGTDTASVAVTYKNIKRTGPRSAFGDNDRSWTLEMHILSDSFSFIHNSIETPISKSRSSRIGVITPFSGSRSSRIGVYLDHSAGILSFYRVSDLNLTLIHRVQTTFTQPLYAGLTLYVHNSYVRFCEF